MTVAPPLLAPGARVALVSPAGPLRGDDDLARAIANVRALGWDPLIGEHVLARDGYFAGADAVRAADFNRALADDAIDAIWCIRGGYGAMRLLDALDFDALAQRPRAIIGYSDITAVHCAVRARCGLVSFHGPTARATLSPFSRGSLARAVIEGTDPCGHAPDARSLRDGRADGLLFGGNVTVLAALAGTPYAPRFDGALVCLEDVNEAVYRIDRALRQLLLAGAFDGCRGIVFGACTHCPEATDDGARRLDDVLAELADTLGVPCLAGVPLGHIDDQWTLPLGAFARLDSAARTLRVAPRQASLADAGDTAGPALVTAAPTRS